MQWVNKKHKLLVKKEYFNTKVASHEISAPKKKNMLKCVSNVFDLSQ